MVPNIAHKYLNAGKGKIKLESNVWGIAPCKSMSIQVAKQDKKENLLRKLYTKYLNKNARDKLDEMIKECKKTQIRKKTIYMINSIKNLIIVIQKC